MLKVLSSFDREGLINRPSKEIRVLTFLVKKIYINNEALQSVYFLRTRKVVVVLVDLKSTRLIQIKKRSILSVLPPVNKLNLYCNKLNQGQVAKSCTTLYLPRFLSRLK